MDPLATLRRLNRAILMGDRDEAMDATRDLSHWLATGGFLPDPSDVASDLEALLSEYHNR